MAVGRDVLQTPSTILREREESQLGGTPAATNTVWRWRAAHTADKLSSPTKIKHSWHGGRRGGGRVAGGGTGVDCEGNEAAVSGSTGAEQEGWGTTT